MKAEDPVKAVRPKTRRSDWRNWMRPNLIIGGLMMGFIFVGMVVGLFWTPTATDAIDIGNRLSGPGENGYLLGSDEFGRDVVTQLMVGARSAVFVSVVSSVSALVLGVIFGGIAALRRGWAEEILMRTSDILYSFPGVVLAIALAAVLGSGITTAVVAIVAIFTPTTARLVRGVSLEVVNRNGFLAARGYGR